MSTPTETVRVNLAERGYAIEIGAGVLDRAGAFIAQRGRVSHAVVITDTNVESPHAHQVAESLTAEDINVDLIVIEAGEKSKSIEWAAGLWDKMLDSGADRKSLVVAVGGGVVGDLAGFIAATYARGIRFVQIPTTLLAQVDSSVGGKVGINLPQAKNMVGAFLQPQGVLIDTQTLDTLEKREYLSGFGEIVKHGVVLDAELFDHLEAHAGALAEREHSVLAPVVAWNCRLKAAVVEADEREESGQRAVLNYGHTFAHPIESLCGYGEFLHGEAVAIGMLCASRLAERLGRVDAKFTRRQHDLLTALGLPTEFPPLDHDKVLHAMTHDKKVQHGRLRFVLPSGLGHAELVDEVASEDVLAALATPGVG